MLIAIVVRAIYLAFFTIYKRNKQYKVYYKDVIE